MERLYNAECNPNELNSLSLAFIGDCVYDLLVREKLICESNKPAGKLHKLSVKQVCCQAQSSAVDKISHLLTQEELAVYKRGRNAHTHHTPKNATNAEYHSATGFESLLGYLYLQNNILRIRELFDIINK